MHIYKSTYPPYGTDCLNEIPNILPIKKSYYENPTPFHPIINYRINPP